MKPQDLVTKYDNNSNWGDKTSGDIRRLIMMNEESCVVAYLQTETGRVMLCKGKRKYYAWVIFKYLSTSRNNIFRLGTKQNNRDDVGEFFKMCKGNYVVCDEKEMKKVKAKRVVESL